MNRETGATMVEFALVSVVAFALIFGLAEIGLVVFGNSIGSSAARDGARVGLVNYVDADVPGSADHRYRRLLQVICHPARNASRDNYCCIRPRLKFASSPAAARGN